MGAYDESGHRPSERPKGGYTLAETPCDVLVYSMDSTYYTQANFFDQCALHSAGACLSPAINP